MNVGILLFDDVQLTDFTGPYDVFVFARDAQGEPAFRVFTLAASPEVRCNGGLIVRTDFGLDDHPPIELLLVPGGRGVRSEENNPALIDWIRDAANASTLAATVCTGARLMAKTGLWDGLQATTHWNSIEYLRSTFPTVEVLEEVRYVDAGKYLSSAGITAGIDLALYIVERLHGSDEAARVARGMEYEARAGLTI